MERYLPSKIIRNILILKLQKQQNHTHNTKVQNLPLTNTVNLHQTKISQVADCNNPPPSMEY
jgi:hypothetical protein